MRRLICATMLVLGLLTALPLAGLAADANNNHDHYLFLIGTGGGGPEGPDVAKAQNGSTVTIVGVGSFNAGPDKAAGGSGTYAVKDAQGSTTSAGTWSVTGVLGFVSYGSAAAQGLPAFLWGGQVKLAVHLSNGVDGVLTVFCLLGSPPAGKDEGITLVLGQGGNFT
ncbi:MAG: hypothetical protein E6I96_07625, partial [Chloroflexi bacterium]